MNGKDSPEGLSLQVGAVVFARLVASVLGAVKVFVLARMLAKFDYGILSFLLTVHGLFVGVGVVALPDSLLYYLPRFGRGTQRRLVWQSTRLVAWIGLACAAALIAAAGIPGWAAKLGGDPWWMSCLLAAMVALELPAQVLPSALLGVSAHRVSSLWSIATSLSSSLSMLIPAALGAPLRTVVASYVVVAAVRLALVLQLAQRYFDDVAAEPFPGGLGAQVRYALPLWLNTATGLLNKNFAALVLGVLLPAPLFAEYAAASQDLPFVTMLPYAVTTALLPALSSRAAGGASGDASPGGASPGVSEALALWHRSVEKVAVVVLPFFALCAVEAPAVITIAYGEAYLGAVPAFRIFLCIMPVRVTAYALMLVALGRPGNVLRAQAAGVVVNLLALAALSLWLEHARGEESAVAVDRAAMWMAAAINVLGIVVSIAWMLRDIGRATGQGLRGAFPWRAYGRRALAALLAMPALALPVPWAHTGLPGAVQQFAWHGALYAAAYLVAASWLGVLTAQDRAFAWRWLRLDPLRRARG